MSNDILALISRWIHVLTAIVAVGGSVFLRLVLMPVASRVLTQEEHERLRGPLIRRWKMFVHTGIALFLLSGFYNYLVVALPQHRGQMLYHMLMGVKILLALAVFFLAIALTSRGGWPIFAAIRAKNRTWLGVLVALAVAVVLIAGYLRALPQL